MTSVEKEPAKAEVVEFVARAARSRGSFVPVVGMGAPHALGVSGREFPTGESLAASLGARLERLDLAPVEVADAKLFLDAGDRASLFTVLGLATDAVEGASRAIARTQYPVPVTGCRDAGMARGYEMFASMNWGVIVATDFDGLIESVLRDEAHRSYDGGERVIDDVKKALGRDARDTLVVRLFGQWRDVFAPALLTWPDMYRHLGLPRGFLSWVADDESRARPEYGAALRRLAARVESRDGIADGSSGWYLDFVRDLAVRSSLLLLGVDRLEPLAMTLRFLAARGEDIDGDAIHSISMTGAAAPLPFVAHLGHDLQRCASDVFEALRGVVAHDDRRRHGGQQHEFQSRVNGYRDLVGRYQWGSAPDAPRWVSDGVATGDGLVPFVELWSNRAGMPCEEAVAVTVPPSPRYVPEADLVEVVDAYWAYSQAQRKLKAKPEPLEDELKVRVNEWRVDDDNRLSIDVEPINYRWYLVTNHFVANVSEEQVNAIARRGDPDLARRLRKYYTDRESRLRFDTRGKLCGTCATIRLAPTALCANHVGISALAIGTYQTIDGGSVPVLICPPSGNQVSSPSEVIPTVSGSMDWPAMLARPTGAGQRVDGGLLVGNLLREFYEECLADGRHLPGDDDRAVERAIHDARAMLRRVELVNLCQNIERGGKPEFFFLVTLAMSANFFLDTVFRPNWELKHTWWDVTEEEIWKGEFSATARRVVLLPSPLDTDLEPHARSHEAAAVLGRVVGDVRYNPVLRASIAAVLRYAGRHAKPDVAGRPKADQ